METFFHHPDELLADEDLVDPEDGQGLANKIKEVVTNPKRLSEMSVRNLERAQDYRPDLTPREYLALAGGPSNRAKLTKTTVTFRNGRTYAMAEAPPLEAGAVVTVPEVAVKWYQDYLAIANTIASLVTAYTGIFVLFNGPLNSNNGN